MNAPHPPQKATDGDIAPMQSTNGFPRQAERTLDASVRGDALLPFFVLTFAITWGLALLIVLFPAAIEAVFGEMSAFNPVFIIAVWGPTLAAVILTWRSDRAAGLRRLLGTLLRWRFGLRWYAFLLLGIPAVGFLLAEFAGPSDAIEITSPGMLAAVLVVLLITGPLGEELGWRGYALPRLLRRSNPLVASLVLGAIWGVWHLPAFFMAGLPQEGLAIPAFLALSLALAVLATWIYLNTGRSVLAVVLFHYTVNLAMTIIGAPLTALMLVALLGAAAVVAFDRSVGWFRRTAIDTEPPPPAVRVAT